MLEKHRGNKWAVFLKFVVRSTLAICVFATERSGNVLHHFPACRLESNTAHQNAISSQSTQYTAELEFPRLNVLEV